jgi:transposase
MILFLNRRATDVRLCEGIDRSQSTLFPAMLDDYLSEDNLFRAVDAFVEGLDLGKLGFGRHEAELPRCTLPYSTC